MDTQQVCPETMAYRGLKAMPDPLYDRWFRLSAYCRVTPQELAVDVLREQWCEVYRYIEEEGRTRIAQTLLIATLHRTIGRTN